MFVRLNWSSASDASWITCDNTDICTSPGDVVLLLKEKPHPRFKRVKNDLYFTANISLAQALCGMTVTVPTLDGRTLPIAVNEVVRPGMQKTVPGEGMPLVADPSRRGNLIISFDIAFPEALSEDQKTSLQAINM